MARSLPLFSILCGRVMCLFGVGRGQASLLGRSQDIQLPSAGARTLCDLEHSQTVSAKNRRLERVALETY
eukprot:5839787-Pyramimonas_sp.AAC.1